MAQRKDPYLGYRFRVEIRGLTTGGFSEVSGLQSELETETYQEGGVNGFEHKLPKFVKYQNLVLKRGVADIDSLWLWYKNVVTGRVERRTISVYLLDSTNTQKRGWVFTDAYPVKWIGPELKAESTVIAVESLEFVHRGLLL